MKRSSVIIIVILFLLGAFSVYVYRSKSGMNTVEDDARNFSFKDTASVTKIFIASKEGFSSEIIRTKSGWVVNGKYPCRSEAILNLLEVIRNVDVKMPVPKEARENVIKYMASGALKVQIYTGNKLVKQYYVGHETPDSEASYMLLTDIESGKNYRQAYACFIPGFVGYLQPRYKALETEWRDRVVLNYTPPEMRQLKVTHLTYPPDSSITIDLKSTTLFSLKDGNGKQVEFDNEKMKQYLIYYQNISYEALVTGKNRRLQDSLSLSVPFSVITVSTTKYSTDVFKLYRKPVRTDITPDIGVKYDYDPDRFYLRFNNDKEWAVAQYFVFGKLLATPAYFQPSTVKK